MGPEEKMIQTKEEEKKTILRKYSTLTRSTNVTVVYVAYFRIVAESTSFETINNVLKTMGM